jgi:hypothetical protein
MDHGNVVPIPEQGDCTILDRTSKRAASSSSSTADSDGVGTPDDAIQRDTEEVEQDWAPMREAVPEADDL